MRFLSIILLCAMLISGCGEKIYFGSTEMGFDDFPDTNTISRASAYQLAKPFLEYSFNKRKKNRSLRYNVVKNWPVDYVVLKGDFYYITRDSYRSEDPKFYLPYAIKVNKNTGQVEKPYPGD